MERRLYYRTLDPQPLGKTEQPTENKPLIRVLNRFSQVLPSLRDVIQSHFDDLLHTPVQRTGMELYIITSLAIRRSKFIGTKDVADMMGIPSNEISRYTDAGMEVAGFGRIYDAAIAEASKLLMSPREKEVLKYKQLGWDAYRIAEKLNTSPQTVRNLTARVGKDY